MCLTVPVKVITIHNQVATVEAMGKTRETSLILLEDAVKPGDYLVLGAAGAFAQEIIPEKDALEAIAYFQDLISQGLVT